MSAIRISIGIPTIGDHPFVAETLEAALAELPADGELVLSDNASNTAAQLQAFKDAHPSRAITIVRQAQRLSMADNWNECLRHARGTFFLLLSDDDVPLPGMVATLAGLLEADPEAGLAYCRFEWIDEAGVRFWTSPKGVARESSVETVLGVFARKRVVLPSATLFRRHDLEAVGGYDAAYENWADMAAWIAVGARYPHVAATDRVLLRYRERRTSLTKTLGDERWTRGVRRTLELLRRLHPADARVVARGTRYHDYLLADIALKRLLAVERSPWRIAQGTFALASALPPGERAWLTAKSVYLRLFAKINPIR